MTINFKKVGVGLFATAATVGAFGLAPGALAVSLEEDLTLTGDVAECYTIPAGKTVTVDLAGHTITCTGDNAFLVENGATLTIKGDSENGGEVKAMTKGKAAVYNNVGGTVIIDDGDYYADNWYTVKNLGTMTIEDGTFSQNEKMYSNTDGYSNASLIANGWYNAKKLNGASDQGNAHTGDIVAELTINGGWFRHFSTTSTIKSDDYSVTNINGGLFESAKGFLVQATGDVTINGGIFDGYSSLLIYNADGTAKYEPGKAVINGGIITAQYIADVRKSYAELTVNGGRFEELEGVYANTELSGALKGGAYNIELATGYLAEGYTAYETKDSGYRVIKTIVTPEVIDIASTEKESMTENGKKMDDVVSEVMNGLVKNYDAVDEDRLELDNGVVVEVIDAAAMRRALENGDEIKLVLASESHALDESELDAVTSLMDDSATMFGAYDYDAFVIAINSAADDASVIARVAEFPEEMELTFSILDAPDVEEGKVRTWTVLRMHDDEVEALPATDNGEGTLLAKTGKFSVFVLTYADVANATEAVETATTPETGASTAATSAASNLAATVALAIIVGIATMIAFEKKFIFKK